MIRPFVVFFILISSNLKAESLPGFVGCGEYRIKGVLVKNLDIIIYKTNTKTNSEMSFTIKEDKDLVLLSSYLNAPTEIRAEITKKMDGTKGEIEHISKISLRKPNPLEPLKDSGIFLITSKACSN
jgi:hypothetical protein